MPTGSYDLAHDDDAGERDADGMLVTEGQRLNDVGRPGEKAEAGEDCAGRNALEDVEDQDCGGDVDRALGEPEGIGSTDANAYPEACTAKD